jgi:hypothetical protein
MSELCESWRSSAAAVTRSRSESSLITLPRPSFSYCLANNQGSYPEKRLQLGQCRFSTHWWRGLSELGMECNNSDYCSQKSDYREKR